MIHSRYPNTHPRGHAAASIRRVLSNLNCFTSDHYFHRIYYLCMQTQTHTSFIFLCVCVCLFIHILATNGPKSSTGVVQQKKHARIRARESDASELLAAINVTIKAIKRCTSNREQIKTHTHTHVHIFTELCGCRCREIFSREFTSRMRALLARPNITSHSVCGCVGAGHVLIRRTLSESSRVSKWMRCCAAIDSAELRLCIRIGRLLLLNATGKCARCMVFP